MYTCGLHTHDTPQIIVSKVCYMCGPCAHTAVAAAAAPVLFGTAIDTYSFAACRSL
jgi:hypothetical protein